MENLSTNSWVICPASSTHPRNTEASIVELESKRLLLAWSRFIGGPRDDSTCEIVARVSTDGGENWDEPVVIKENDGGMNVMSASLLRLSDGALGAAHCRKDGHDKCSVYFRRSEDEGRTWGDDIWATPIEGYTGMLNDSLVQLSSGRLLAPYSTSPECWSDREHFVAGVGISDDAGRTWRTPGPSVDAPQRGAMEPGVIQRADGSLVMYYRTQLGTIWYAESTDSGESWGEGRSWGVVSSEAPQRIARIPSTGEWLMVWNHLYIGGEGHGGPRRPLHLAVSPDEGRTWKRERIVDNHEVHTFAYPSISFSGGMVLITYYFSTTSIALGTETEMRNSLKLLRIPEDDL